jgi:hypothetical protein
MRNDRREPVNLTIPCIIMTLLIMMRDRLLFDDVRSAKILASGIIMVIRWWS